MILFVKQLLYIMHCSYTDELYGFNIIVQEYLHKLSLGTSLLQF